MNENNEEIEEDGSYKNNRIEEIERITIKLLNITVEDYTYLNLNYNFPYKSIKYALVCYYVMHKNEHVREKIINFLNDYSDMENIEENGKYIKEKDYETILNENGKNRLEQMIESFENILE